MVKQLCLFDGGADNSNQDQAPEPTTYKKKRKTGGSTNPIVFHDYAGFLKKFEKQEKTTDDTYTPPDVFEAVLRYVGEITDLSNKLILRPFFPGGDYINAEYPADGVVVDNPPFSQFNQICRFFSANKIPFFLFAPGMTVLNCVQYCTAVITGVQLKFQNKAIIRINFASNLFGEKIVQTAPRLKAYLYACPSQMRPERLEQRQYPPELVGVSQLHTITDNGFEFSIKRKQAAKIREIDGVHLFGDHLLVAPSVAEEKERLRTSKKKPTALAKRTIRLGEKEKKIIEGLE